MTITFRDRLIAGILACGYKQDPNERSHYTAFTKPDKARKLFVGTNGALRCGSCASKSYSIGCPSDLTPIYRSFLKWGDQALNAQKPPELSAFE